MKTCNTKIQYSNQHQPNFQAAENQGSGKKSFVNALLYLRHTIADILCFRQIISFSSAVHLRLRDISAEKLPHHQLAPVPLTQPATNQ